MHKKEEAVEVVNKICQGLVFGHFVQQAEQQLFQ